MFPFKNLLGLCCVVDGQGSVMWLEVVKERERDDFFEDIESVEENVFKN